VEGWQELTVNPKYGGIFGGMRKNPPQINIIIRIVILYVRSPSSQEKIHFCVLNILANRHFLRFFQLLYDKHNWREAVILWSLQRKPFVQKMNPLCPGIGFFESGTGASTVTHISDGIWTAYLCIGTSFPSIPRIQPYPEQNSSERRRRSLIGRWFLLRF